MEMKWNTALEHFSPKILKLPLVKGKKYINKYRKSIATTQFWIPHTIKKIFS